MTIRLRGLAALAGAAVAVAMTGAALSANPGPWSPGPANWKGDLSPITAADWNYDRAAHLLSRAGFSGTPEEIARLATMTPERAVRSLVYYETIPNPKLTPFIESGFWDPSLTYFPDSRPAATDKALKDGGNIGVMNKPDGNRAVQPTSDRFFYWLRATELETRRVGQWFAERMLDTTHPLEEKMALFWHGHFATAEGKVRDYRKMVQQIDMFEKYATGNFAQLAINVAQNPAMLYFLDAGVNVKGAANENFAREVMELFTMGVGNYIEKDVREAARAFTGWNFDNLDFVVDKEKHDDGVKTFLGRTGNFNGVDVLKIIFEQPVTADYIAGKVYKYFVRDDISPEQKAQLGKILRDNNYEMKPLLLTLFMSKDFYSAASYGSHIKGPVEHVVTMMKQLGAPEIPGIPDFTLTTTGLGQTLLNPPSVAGWAQGKSWITPAIVMERGNIARDYLFPNIVSFRDPNLLNTNTGTDGQIGDRLRKGADYTQATALADPGMMGAFDMVARERDELFNTRVSGYYAWELAYRKLIPTPRGAARVDITDMVVGSGVKTTSEAVDYMLGRFLRVPASAEMRKALVAFLNTELGTTDMVRARTYSETPLRMVTHMIMSTPEYQIN